MEGEVLILQCSQGLGDWCQFLRAVCLYRSLGHDIEVACDWSKAQLVAAHGLTPILDCPDPTWHKWPFDAEGQVNTFLDATLPEELSNRAAWQLNKPPFPVDPRATWEALAAFQVQGQIDANQEQEAERWLRKQHLRHPVALVCSTAQHFTPEKKQIPRDMAIYLYRGLIDKGYSVIDLDQRHALQPPEFKHGCFAHVIRDWKRLRIKDLLALYSVVAKGGGVMVGIDSGPTYCAMLVPQLPVIQVGFDYHLSCVSLPSPNFKYLVRSGPYKWQNMYDWTSPTDILNFIPSHPRTWVESAYTVYGKDKNEILRNTKEACRTHKRLSIADAYLNQHGNCGEGKLGLTFLLRHKRWTVEGVDERGLIVLAVPFIEK